MTTAQAGTGKNVTSVNIRVRTLHVIEVEVADS